MLTAADFWRLEPRSAAYASFKAQKRAGLEPQPHRPMTDDLLRHITEADAPRLHFKDDA